MNQVASTFCPKNAFIYTYIITTFLPLILTLNKFAFDCIHYFQIKGCAMDIICANAYANIFMANF